MNGMMCECRLYFLQTVPPDVYCWKVQGPESAYCKATEHKTLHSTVIWGNELPGHFPGFSFILRAMYGYKLVLMG